METVKLIIDRKPVEVPKGTTILDAAKGMGIRIPTLCYMKLEDLHYENNPGACRICVVEIEGRRNLAPSCKTECMEGMVVQTHSPRVMNARKTVMELILSNHLAVAMDIVNYKQLLTTWGYVRFAIKARCPHSR